MMNLPIDFETRMKATLQDEWDDFLECYANHKFQALRVNALKVHTDAHQDVLAAANIMAPEAVPWAANGYYYVESDEVRPGKHPYHEMGLYYIQEPSAMSAAGLLDVQAGDKVLDLCAAPGGKSTQLAALLGRAGTLVSNEIVPGRAKVLSQNIERMGIGNCMVTNAAPDQLSAHFPMFFDRILVDAPCSGEGMFRKNPEAMNEWSLAQVKVCADRQADILEEAAVMLKPGGRMVYSTCTFAPEEDELCMANFIKAHPEFSIVQVDAPWFSKCEPADVAGIDETYRLWPHKLHGEGHYVAVLEKRGVSDVGEMAGTTAKYMSPKEMKKAGKKSGNTKSNTLLSKAQQEDLDAFLDTTLTADAAIKLRTRMGQAIMFGEQLYLLPDGLTAAKGLKIERPGLHLGTFKKDRFEPSHALALYLTRDEIKQSFNFALQDVRAVKYFNGESIFLTEDELAEANLKKGFCVVCIDGYAAGFGKLAGAQIKNHYPKGLRKVF